MPVKSLLATGEALVGNGMRSFDSSIREVLGLPIKEIQIVSYGFDRSFGPVLEGLLFKNYRAGARMTVITRPPREHEPGVRQTLMVLEEEGVLVQAPSECGGLLHIKALVVNREHAILGSANFTYGGLTVNHELGVWLTGKEAWEIGKTVDRLEGYLKKCQK
ncbi:putative endonuclease [Oceanithermus profundus DSM 14977]|uniref:Putative endonuclease n=1 Tax=Oceanithermus profundus (strain DSM 14977 / NBRC 100410 / VKM B-2274 / 506) TaxID=670487 RepID=E4U6D7_OCEP5|nr:phospholipase D-like domain-containing protein [Oceanithermus profundus]ADR35557.1 putative endonuclease [Oceanithermus profundus DSM 14977]